jgi:hypothetical protein
LKLVVVALGCGIGLLATPALAQTADQLAAMCDFVQTGMIHSDENFARVVAGPPDAGGAYPMARPYAWPDAGCAVTKGDHWVMACTWDIAGITTAQQSERALSAVGDQISGCIGSAYQRSRDADGYLVFSLQAKTRIEAAIREVDGKRRLTIGVLGRS